VVGTEDALAAVVANDAPEVFGPSAPERATGVSVRGPADVAVLVDAPEVGIVLGTAGGSAHDVTPRACFRR
jgi:hypothetical protein